MKNIKKIVKFVFILFSMAVINSIDLVMAQQKLPFIGTKYFNFAGGSGTGQSITIQKDGTTILKSYGKISSSVNWVGKFSNPLMLKNQVIFGRNLSALLLKNNKIYAMGDNGKVISDCRGKGTICESNLGP